MSLGSTVWLWLLAAVAIPIIIHLWQRKSGKPQLLGTFRFLPDQSFAKSKKIELHEVPLLIVRMLLVCLIVLLLTDLLILNEKPEVDSVIITETNRLGWQQRFLDGNLEIDVPSSQVESIGWWNMVEQADANHQPNVIYVNGGLTQNRFLGSRPDLDADVEWNGIETESEKISVIWQSETFGYSGFLQRKDSLGVHHSVEQTSEPEILNNLQAVIRQDTVAYTGNLQIFINPDIPQQIQNGLEYAAEFWNADIEYRNQPQQILCTVLTGTRQFVLRNESNPGGISDVLETGPQTGVEIEVTELDSSIKSSPNTIIKTKNGTLALWFRDDQTLQVNGVISDEMAAWFYAGVGHQLMQKSLDIDQFLNPEMPEQQKQIRQTEQQLATIANRTSARSWLLILLLILWASERFMAPRRGM